MSGEMDMHGAFSKWLKENGIRYIHATFGKRSTMTKDWPDYTLIHCNRALLIELKTEKGALTKGQQELFAKIARESGTVVYICRSVEEAVNFARQWLGTLPPMNAPKPEEKPRGEAADQFAGQFTQLRIGAWGGTQWLYGKDRKQTWTGIRPATPDDIAKYPS